MLFPGASDPLVHACRRPCGFGTRAVQVWKIVAVVSGVEWNSATAIEIIAFQVDAGFPPSVFGVDFWTLCHRFQTDSSTRLVILYTSHLLPPRVSECFVLAAA